MSKRIPLLLFLVITVGLETDCKRGGPASSVSFPVTFIEGDCFLINAGTTRSIRHGTGVASGDTLLTSYNGKLRLSFNDSDYVVMDRSSKAVIQAGDSLHVTVKLLHGKLYSNVVLLPKRGSFRTITPKIQTSVRGTAYTVEVDSEETAISVLEGTVSVTDNDSLCPIQVNQGERAVVNPGNFPCRIRSASIQELKALVQWVGKSFVNFRKILEYKNDLRFIAKLKELDLIPQEMTPRLLSAAASLDTRDAAAPPPDVQPTRIEKPRPRLLPKSDLSDESFRDPEHIRWLISEHRNLIQALYNQELKKQGPFAGRVIIRFILRSNGRVTEPVVVSSTTGKPQFDSLLTLRIMQLKFKPVRTLGDISIVYPFDFAAD